MSEFIRVRWSDSGTEQSIPKPVVLDEDAYEVLDEAAADHNGRTLPAKVRTAPTHDDMKVDDLKALVALRNQGRDEADQIPVVGNKPDLITALAADDKKKEH